MKKILIFIILLFFAIFYSINNVASHTKDWSQVQKIFGQKGIQQGNTIRINFTRTDIPLKINGREVQPNMALGGYVSFSPMHDHSMMMCTMVLLPSEVEPVIEKLVANNIEVAAIHNHLLGENPRIMYLHCSAHGDAVKLAKAFKSALSVTKTPLSSKTVYQKSDINWKNVESIIGAKGQKQGSLIMFTIPRADKIYDMDTEIPTLMGVGQSINMQKVGNKAISVGDFVVTAKEVNPLLKALTNNGIRVTSIHNHMLDENPRTFCLHYWGYGDPDDLAKGLKAGLNKINIVKSR